MSVDTLILVNAKHGYQEPEDRAPLASVDGGVPLLRCAAEALEWLMTEIRGWSGIAAISGWRSLAEQQQIWDNSLRENGEAFTRRYVALPGHSEHQTGLAIDLGQRTGHIDFIRPHFPDTGLCRVFQGRAAEFGFILRYPAGKEHITGIAHEPWHFRYVGTPHAAYILQMGLTLEEYHALRKVGC